MHKKKHFMLILSLLMLVIVGAGCTPNEEKSALKDEQGNTVSLDNKEKPTLVFFFTGVGWDYCKSQLVELQNNQDLFVGFQGDIYALSADPVEKHKELKAELGLEFPILSDKYLKVIEEAGLKDPGEPKSLRGFAIYNNEGELIESTQIDSFGDEIVNIISYAAEKTAN
jgi:peroxiredoxin